MPTGGLDYGGLLQNFISVRVNKEPTGTYRVMGPRTGCNMGYGDLQVMEGYRELNGDIQGL